MTIYRYQIRGGPQDGAEFQIPLSEHIRSGIDPNTAGPMAQLIVVPIRFSETLADGTRIIDYAEQQRIADLLTKLDLNWYLHDRQHQPPREEE